jgi:hypothetical protein
VGHPRRASSAERKGGYLKGVRTFLVRHLPTIVVLSLAICSLALFRHYWGDAARAQAVGAMLGFLAAAILVGVTWEYVRINQRILALQQAQWEEQNKVVLRFGIKLYHGKAQLWVANIGRTDFLISEVLVRKRGEEILRNERRVVRSGSRQSLALPEKVWSGIALISAFDVRLRYESQHDSGLSVARAYTLLIGEGSSVIRVRKGIDDTWWVACPKCDQLAASMITENLDNFDAALKRQSVMESELKVSCPDHGSQWADSTEQIRDRHERKKKGTVEEE